MTTLSVSSLFKSFSGNVVLGGIDLTVTSGSLTAILGPSGSGKTTLLRVIAGFEHADGGVVALDDELLDAPRCFVPSEQRGIGYVPQEGNLFPHLSVARNIGFGLRRGRERADRVAELLAMINMEGLGGRYPNQLSGGQQQRVALARALAVRPRLVLLDEPFSSLDASLRALVRSEVVEMLRSERTTSLLVTHDQDEALSVADHVAVMRDGRIGQHDTPRGLYTYPVDRELAGSVGEANLVRGEVRGELVETELGSLMLARPVPAGEAVVLVRPEQIVVEPSGGEGRAATVVGSSYYGHDAILRVLLEGAGAVALTVRVQGTDVLEDGSLVSLRVHGAVAAWTEDKSSSI